MFHRSNRTRLFSVATAFAFLVLTFDAFGQCGVYFKRAKTWSFPVSRIHLDHAADMTGDGLPDLVVSDNGAWGDRERVRILILPNLGNGNFGAPWAIIQPPSPLLFSNQYLVAKVNADSRPDLLVMIGSHPTPSTAIAFINNGDGTFTSGPETTFGPNIGTGDLDGDGLGDVFFRSNLESRFSKGNGNGTFNSSVLMFAGNTHAGLRAGDFTGDGRMDLVDTRHLHITNGDMTWGSTDITGLLDDANPGGFADFNGDGKLDLVTNGGELFGLNDFRVLIGTGTSFTPTAFSVDPSWAGNTIVANWSGNAAPDFVFQPKNLSKKIVFTNDGAGNFTQTIENGRADIPTGQKYAIADFDDDGKADQLLATSNIPESPLVSTSTILFKDVTSFTFLKQVCDQPGQSRIVSYDRSNASSWSYWNPATGAWTGRTRSFPRGTPFVIETINWGLGSLGDIPTPGDFDGDGVTDRAVYRRPTGYWYILKSSDGNWLGIPFGAAEDKPVAADYDGDSITDIAVYRPSDGVWHIWYMGTQQYAGFRFGASEDKPVQADYDGDFKTDIAVFRPSNGVWYVLKSTDWDYFSVLWGFGTDRPIPGDYDGDGKADISVWRESPDRVAYVLRSSNLSVSAYQWGAAGDILQIGDYDGDFVDDITVFRPSNNNWYSTTYPFGSLTGVFGVSGAIPTSAILKVE